MNFPSKSLVFLSILGLVLAAELEIPENDLEDKGSNQKGELLLVQSIARHGDRTPAFTYSNDPYVNFSWPEGIGNLINRGIQRMFRYGTVLRRRYLKYMENIRIKNVRAQSSPIRRCLESEQAFMTGLFPPLHVLNQIWSDSHSGRERTLAQNWQPVGIESVEESRSWKLYPGAPCPKADLIDSQLPSQVPELAQFIAENAEFTQKVFQYSGFPPVSWAYVGYLYDVILVEKEYFGADFIEPAWLDQVGPETYEKMATYFDMVLWSQGQSLQYVKLRVGTFLKEIVDNMKAINAGQSVTLETRKLFSYSSHDTQIGYIMHALGFYSGRPSYGSGVLFELRKHRNSAQPMVHLFYANVTNNYEIYPLKLNESPRFSTLCTRTYCELANFELSLAGYLESDVENDCKL